MIFLKLSKGCAPESRRPLMALHLRPGEPDAARDLLEPGVLEIRLLTVQSVVRRPEALLALCVVGDAGEGGGGLRTVVERKRIVLPDDAHVGGVAVLDLLHRRLDALAEGALEIRPLDDGHQGIGRATDWILRVDRHLPYRLVVLLGRRWLLLRLVRRGLIRSLVELLAERHVQLARLGPRLQELLRLLELLVDDLLEVLEGLRAADRHAVDAERGRAVRADLRRERHILVDLRRELLRGEGRLELAGIHASSGRPLLVVLVGEVLLVREREVVELPERLVAAQPVDGHRGIRRRARAVMERKWLVLPDHADLLGPVGIPNLLQRRLDARAEWALKVADGHDRDRRSGLAPLRVLAGDRHG